MSEHPWSEMVAPYVLDALDREEGSFFEAHLAQCEQCRAEVDELREAAGMLAFAAAPVQPPAGLRERILADARRSGPAVREREPAPPAGRPEPVRMVTRPAAPSRMPWLAAAASLVLALLAGTLLLQERQQRAALESELSQAVRTVEQRDSLLARVLGPEVQTATLAATGEAPTMRLFWDREQGVVVLSARNLAPPAAGRTYQLWGIAEGEAPVSLGTFATDADGRAVVSLSVPPRIALDISAVTEEPAGGSPQPTSTPFLVGEWSDAAR